jgi:hypothetical protein
MAKKKRSRTRSHSRDDLKAEAVPMMLDGPSAESVATRLGLGGSAGRPTIRWRAALRPVPWRSDLSSPGRYCVVSSRDELP